MVTGSQKNFILNALELYKKKIHSNERELERQIWDTFPRDQDATPIPEIMEEIRNALPEKFGVRWKGKGFDCCKERFKVTVEVYIDTAEIEITNEKMREAAKKKLAAIIKEKEVALDAWNANAWVALANKQEVPVFDTNLELDFTNPAILKE